ncbi:MAG: nucleotidyltransferase family protein [Anaerolineales bacterium]|jgi:molybdenum cofactor cytidylyltransferase
MITALILAAGQSKRMGQPKMLLPWGETTVLEKVIATFRVAEIDEILVVTGGAREQIEVLVKDSARTVFNPEYANGEMLSSVQAGLAGLEPGTESVLIGLGDQPQARESIVRLVLDEYHASKASIVVPSFQMQRGHPWLVARDHWSEILEMHSPASLRDFLNSHTDEIHYVEVYNDSILQDLDTPEDYLKFRP